MPLIQACLPVSHHGEEVVRVAEREKITRVFTID